MPATPTTQPDDFLDALASLLADEDDGVAEFTADNIVVWHHGEADPDEDIQRGMKKCRAVSLLIHDLGGETDPQAPSNPVISHEVALDLYVDPTKRNRRADSTLRLAGAIRDDIMRKVYRAHSLRGTQHSFFDTRVLRWSPLDDPDYVAYRITVSRPISLE